MKQILIWATLAVFTVALFYIALVIPFGTPLKSDMDDYFIAHGQEQTGGNNIVTNIVFDYRGFDTLGEACVLFTAVMGVAVMFTKRRKEEGYEYE
ncbi:MAG TPA: hydrogen gas-evolving membrane-bound hydrogenase subunit E [Methanospirillum sp.]|nr:hydrogen gas-evolving membrane-bound hydrogenase subunit E [Methanospirillum sp.]